MSELSPKELEEIRNWNYATQKGRIAAFVARGKENPSTISKALITLMRRGKLSEQELDKMLLQVERESVDTEGFHRDKSYGGRKGRFDRLKGELRMKDQD